MTTTMTMEETPKCRLVFDIEADGFLDAVTKIHCIAIKDIDTGESTLYTGTHVLNGLRRLEVADEIIGHNIIGYDIPAIQKVYPKWTYSGKAVDTMVCTRLIWSDVKQHDFRRKNFNKKLIGSHSLEAWGWRLGNYKGDFKGPWDTYTQEMGDYCRQDVEVTADLFSKIEKQNYSPEALELEHEFAEIIFKQQVHGFHFDVQACQELYAELCDKRAKMEVELKDVFGPTVIKIPFTPKRNDSKRGYIRGVPTEKIIINEFNPRSRVQIYERLIESFGWKPKSFTDSGAPKVSEGILKALPWPEANMLAEYLMIQKRIGQIAEGKNGWLKLEKNGRIHGSVNTNGTPTGRCIHFKPNISQATSVDKPYGPESRACFTSGPNGFVLLGIDLSGIELRLFGHFLCKYDKGALIKAILEGKNEDGTDMHSRNRDALQRYFPEATRNHAKTAVYALLYGAGDKKLGKTFGKGAKSGALVRKALFEGMTGLSSLQAKIVSQISKRRWKKVKGKRKKSVPYLLGLDGRKMPVRSEHSALNLLFQGAASVIMKKVTVEFHKRMAAKGYLWASGLCPAYYAQQAHIHDEMQLKIKPEIAEEAGELFRQVTREVGEYFNLKCPLDAEYKIGKNWAETH